MVFSPKLVARYKELKEEAPDCLLLMQYSMVVSPPVEPGQKTVTMLAPRPESNSLSEDPRGFENPWGLWF